MNFESFNEEELNVPTAEEMDEIEKQRAEAPEVFEEKLPESVVNELISGAYEEELKNNPDIPDSERELLETQGEMIAGEAKELEKQPGFMSKLGARAKKTVVVGVMALSIFAGSMAVEKKEAKAFDLQGVMERVAEKVVRQDTQDQVRIYREKEQEARRNKDYEAERHWRNKRILAEEMGREAQDEIRGKINERRQKESRKKADKARYESQVRAAQQRAISQQQAAQRAAESRARMSKWGKK